MFLGKRMVDKINRLGFIDVSLENEGNEVEDWDFEKVYDVCLGPVRMVKKVWYKAESTDLGVYADELSQDLVKWIIKQLYDALPPQQSGGYYVTHSLNIAKLLHDNVVTLCSLGGVCLVDVEGDKHIVHDNAFISDFQIEKPVKVQLGLVKERFEVEKEPDSDYIRVEIGLKANVKIKW